MWHDESIHFFFFLSLTLSLSVIHASYSFVYLMTMIKLGVVEDIHALTCIHIHADIDSFNSSNKLVNIKNGASFYCVNVYHASHWLSNRQATFSCNHKEVQTFPLTRKIALSSALTTSESFLFLVFLSPLFNKRTRSNMSRGLSFSSPTPFFVC